MWSESEMWRRCTRTFLLFCSLAIVPPFAVAQDGRRSSEPCSHVQENGNSSELLSTARAVLQANPVVSQYLGTICYLALDDEATSDYVGALDVLVFDVEGTLGKGRIGASFDESAVHRADLVLSDGTIFHINRGLETRAPDPDQRTEQPVRSVAAGQSEFVVQARAAVAANQAVLKYVGRIEHFLLDTAATGAQSAGTFVFEIKGDKGSGRLEAAFASVDASTERLEAGVLKMADGARYSLQP